MKKLTATQFYILSFTWGLPMSLIGLGAYIILRMRGLKPQKHDHCYRFETGENWGGVTLGWVIITNTNASEFIKTHELGHTYQNACLFGLAMPILSLISASRYLLKYKLGMNLDYYSWWFESQANEIGKNILNDET